MIRTATWVMSGICFALQATSTLAQATEYKTVTLKDLKPGKYSITPIQGDNDRVVVWGMDDARKPVGDGMTLTITGLKLEVVPANLPGVPNGGCLMIRKDGTPVHDPYCRLVRGPLQ